MIEIQKTCPGCTAGFYRIGCTAHYRPVATGPFATEEEGIEFAIRNRLDVGVHNPPPFSVEFFDSKEEAQIAAEALTVGYRSE